MRRVRWMIVAIACSAIASELALGTVARAEPVYRCRDPNGAVAYQDRPCAAQQAQAVVAIEPAPVIDAAATTEAPDRRVPASSRTPARARAARSAPATSWQCRAASGEVFYRHSRCPKTLPSTTPPTHRGGASPARIGIAATPVPRSQACRGMASGYGRKGADLDERASTYDRNLGRDPCRHP